MESREGLCFFFELYLFQTILLVMIFTKIWFQGYWQENTQLFHMWDIRWVCVLLLVVSVSLSKIRKMQGWWYLWDLIVVFFQVYFVNGINSICWPWYQIFSNWFWMPLFSCSDKWECQKFAFVWQEEKHTVLGIWQVSRVAPYLSPQRLQLSEYERLLFSLHPCRAEQICRTAKCGSPWSSSSEMCVLGWALSAQRSPPRSSLPVFSFDSLG